MILMSNAMMGAAGQQVAGGGAYAYWRLYITDSQSGSVAELAEIEMRDQPGGLDLCAGGTPSASSVWPINSHLYTAEKAFDGGNATFWNSDGNGFPHWIAYAFSSPVSVSEIALRSRIPTPHNTPYQFTLQYSGDGLTWNDAASWENTSTVAGELRIFSV